MDVILKLVKDYTLDYNANSLSKEMGITPMGTLKILNKLHKQGIISKQQYGKAFFYKLNFESEYARLFTGFILQKEAQESIPRIKRWATEIEHFRKYAEIAVLFGSVLSTDKYNDVDTVLVFNSVNLKKVNSLLQERNELSTRPIHLIKLTTQDLQKNLSSKNAAMVQAIKNGIVLFGQEKLLEVLSSVTHRQ